MRKPMTVKPHSNTSIDQRVITPHDTNYLETPCVAIYVSGSGALKYENLSGNVITISNVGTGLLPIGATKVFATGTTATGLLALY